MSMRRYLPVAARQDVVRRPQKSSAFNFVRYVFVREGTIHVYTANGSRTMSPGDVLVLGANQWCRVEPEEPTLLTTVFVDSNYLCDLLMWQFAPRFRDRSHVLQFLQETFPTAEKLLVAGETRLQRIEDTLDGFVDASTVAEPSFFALRMFFGAVLEYVNSLFDHDKFEAALDGGRGPDPGAYLARPVSAEARELRSLLQADYVRRWTMDELAARVHLSPSQAYRKFSTAYGTSPLRYQSLLRVRRMAFLVREQSMSVRSAAAQVGWNDASHAADIFRRQLGLSPNEYRKAGFLPLAGDFERF